jgi:hypothetical protein
MQPMSFGDTKVRLANPDAAELRGTATVRNRLVNYLKDFTPCNAAK